MIAPVHRVLCQYLGCDPLAFSAWKHTDVDENGCIKQHVDDVLEGSIFCAHAEPIVPSETASKTVAGSSRVRTCWYQIKAQLAQALTSYPR